MKALFVIDDTYGDHDAIGVGILSAIAKRKKWKTSLIIKSRNSNASIINRVESFQPDCIAYSLATGEHRGILGLHKEIQKRYTCHYIFGGPHPTYLPEFIKEDSVDTICIGEGEMAFECYLGKIEKNEDYAGVNNLLLKRDNKIIRNELYPLIEDLDSIPFPDRGIFMEEIPDLYRYYVFICTSRGCPHSCSYCSNPLFNKLYAKDGKPLRIRSVKSIIEEIMGLNFKPQTVIFYDDNFLIKPDTWLKEFVEVYGTKLSLPFAICTSADRIKEPIIKSLKKIGLRSVVYALETGDDQVNRNLLKRSINIDTVIEAGKILNKNRIFSTLQSITLLPLADPFELDLRTLKINQKIRPTLAVSTPLTPYPNTEITKYSIQYGYLSPNHIDRIEKINKVNTVLSFKNKSSMKKSLIIHYFFDLLVHYPRLTFIYKLHYLLPSRYLSNFYNIYEILFAYKRYFLYIGVKLNFSNIKRLFVKYVRYKFTQR